MKFTNLLFVDDLKTCTQNKQNVIQKLELSNSKFSNDIGMEFGVGKCAYLRKGQKKICRRQHRNQRTENG